MTQQRFKSAREENARMTRVLRAQQFINCRWKDIRVGDIVKIHGGEEIPADIIPLYSSEENGICYVGTANLDG
jgi:phospholipid-transporting ATPase